MYRDSSMAPVLDLWRRLTAVGDVLGGMLRQWDRILRFGAMV